MRTVEAGNRGTNARGETICTSPPLTQCCTEHRLINISVAMQLQMFSSKYIYYVNNNKKKMTYSIIHNGCRAAGGQHGSLYFR